MRIETGPLRSSRAVGTCDVRRQTFPRRVFVRSAGAILATSTRTPDGPAARGAVHLPKMIFVIACSAGPLRPAGARSTSSRSTAPPSTIYMARPPPGGEGAPPLPPRIRFRREPRSALDRADEGEGVARWGGEGSAACELRTPHPPPDRGPHPSSEIIDIFS